ncbi:MAG: Zn-ribbon domain-containing OB-fold protein [Phototrophicaceae bacterium]
MFQTNQQSQPKQVNFIGEGVIYSYTVVQDAPEGFMEQAPYILALVKLDEGAMVTAQLTDVDAPIAIGDRVEMVTRKLSTDGKQGTIVYGYKFRPTLTA